MATTQGVTRYPLRVWLVGLALVVVAIGFQWALVHPIADTRPCIGQLPDPLFDLVPYDHRWYIVSFDWYVVLTIIIPLVMLAEAVRGDHRIVRFGFAYALVGIFRGITIYLVPLCRVTVEPGTCALAETPMFELGPIAFPWRPFAVNDLMFSGHVSAYLLFIWASRGWPLWARAALWTYQGLQIVALVSTRGHYTADILVAFPMAWVAWELSTKLLARLTRSGPDRTHPLGDMRSP